MKKANQTKRARTLSAVQTLNSLPKEKLQKILTLQQPKMIKGRRLGFETAILHFAASDRSGYNVCPNASVVCKDLCFGHNYGLGQMPMQQAARIKKTRAYFERKAEFEMQLEKEIQNFVTWTVNKRGRVPAIRLNGTSDLPALALKFARKFPNVQFYDFTKVFKTLTRADLPANYDLTFSRSETNEREWRRALALGYKVSIVTDLTAQELQAYLKLPAETAFVDGDETDLQFLHPAGAVIMLKPKGRAGKDKRGFSILRAQVFAQSDATPGHAPKPVKTRRLRRSFAQLKRAVLDAQAA